MERTTEVFNALFAAGTVPAPWKEVVVPMLYKKGDIRGAGNYGWIPHNAGFGFLDLAPSILHSNWFWDYIS